MNGKMHLLEIYDADDYEGPNPVRIIGECVIHGPENTPYYIVRPEQPMEYAGGTIEHMALRTHYETDPIDRATGSVCTVGIALTRPGRDYVPGECFGFSDFPFWHVGKVHPCEES